MGIVVGKFWKKKSTYEILEKLENDITSIEEFGRRTEQFRKKVITRFVLLAITFYIALACLLYFYYQKIDSHQKLVYFVPFVAFPFIIWILKKFLTWYYAKKLQRNEKKLVKLKEEKKKIIDNVMETETYKVAKKIIDKFGNDKIQPDTTVSTKVIARQNTPGTALRQRLSFNTPLAKRNPSDQIDRTFTMQQQLQARPFSLPSRRNPSTPLLPQSSSTPMSLSTTRNVLPGNRSILDKMVDYLVGDGPSNRYALICAKCSFHNGMAMKEEFEYVSFACCYCGQFNPARKKKPIGPKFEHRPVAETATRDSSSDTGDSSETEDVTKRLSATETRESPRRNSDGERTSDFDKLSDFEGKESGAIGESTVRPETTKDLDKGGNVVEGSNES
ncbi:unnamed protein product [Phyllotreta striolata]|uniref:Endoplasmic reticulum junction formation protein lunapark n=1 Tax=Phyllotreta striolata TaxID=444603 RepID=A0A9N9TPM6_PHYSR|nr:unnamed protein product [Phyllotreta striolata]